MNAVARLVIASVLSISLIGACTWLAGVIWFAWWTTTAELPDNVGFGYYRDFDIARDALEHSKCAESIEYARHEDVTLESFHFRIRTESGWLVRLWFDEGMNVKRVCSNPLGVVVFSPIDWKHFSRAYSVAELSARLAEKGKRLTNVNDVLCNMGELAPMFRANYDNENIPRITYEDPNFNHYLQIEIVEEGRGNEFGYSRIR